MKTFLAPSDTHADRPSNGGSDDAARAARVAVTPVEALSPADFTADVPTSLLVQLFGLSPR